MPIALLTLLVAPAHATLTLAGEDAPTDPPWEKPATLDYVRSNGTASSTIDAQLDYKTDSLKRSSEGAVRSGFTFGAYVHKDTAAESPKNDRGVSAGFSRFLVPDRGCPFDTLCDMLMSAKLKFGKSLQEVTDSAGVITHPDKTKDRETVLLSGYFEPRFSTPDKASPRFPKLFFTADTGLYSDHASGSGKGNGRLSGGLVDIGINLAPVGIDPESNTYGSLTMIPLVYATAKVEKDFADSGDRKQSTYRLYSVGVTLTFGKVNDDPNTIVPSLNIERSTGADLLTGRARAAKTEIAFGLSF